MFDSLFSGKNAKALQQRLHCRGLDWRASVATVPPIKRNPCKHFVSTLQVWSSWEGVFGVTQSAGFFKGFWDH